MKFQKNYYQAIIKGGGLEYADTLLKTSELCTIEGELQSDFILNVNGLECRWESIPSPKDKTISLLIKSKKDAYYKSILNHLDLILGSTKARHPIREDNLKMSFDRQTLKTEGMLYGKSFFTRHWTMFNILENILGSILMRFGIAEWALYKSGLVSTTDTEKFDDMLRMVISLKYTEITTLKKYLESEYKKIL